MQICSIYRLFAKNITYIHTYRYYTHICMYLYCVCMYTCRQTCKSLYVCVYCILNILMHVCIHTYMTHTFQPRNICNLELSIFTVFRFTYFQISKISLLIEIWKSDNSGNMVISTSLINSYLSLSSL